MNNVYSKCRKNKRIKIHLSFRRPLRRSGNKIRSVKFPNTMIIVIILHNYILRKLMLHAAIESSIDEDRINSKKGAPQTTLKRTFGVFG
jgi:hypothetical protein